MNHFQKFIVTVIVGIAALVSEFIFHQSAWSFWLVAIIGSLMALSMLVEMIKTLRSGRYGVDILAITAIVATLAVGEYWASLMILIMLTGGDSLEDYASKQASKELRSLLDNSPQTAHLVQQETIQDIKVEELVIGDVVLVKPGELIPVDGQILTGEAILDESSLTGESRPVTKKIGDEVMSGAVNGDTSFRMTVKKVAADSQYQTIVKLVKESQAKPAHFVRMADRYAVPFTLIAYLIGGIAWFVTKDPVRFAEVLVVASPCPLILAAPIALVAGMSRSSRNGVIVKTGTTIEKLAGAQTIAFDKTGTITEGQLNVAQINPVGEISKEALLSYVASAEQSSSHILARSLVNYAKGKVDLREVDSIEEVTGSGIIAQIDGNSWKIGRSDFAGAVKNGTTDSNQTIIYISKDDEFIGTITFEDILRPETKKTIDVLKQLGLRKVLMLTGDHQKIADQIAKEVGITDVYAECLPKDKIEIIKNTPENQRPVIMVGDGVNDAPALAVADIGIAMGAHGSTAASESADAVILKDDLSRVSTAMSVAKDTMKIARQSVLIGIFICVGLMLIASTGVIPALFGAVLQEVVDTVSILSALRAKND